MTATRRTLLGTALAVLLAFRCGGADDPGQRHAGPPAVWSRAHRLAAHAGPVTGAVFIEGRRALTAGEDGRLLVWSLDDPQERPREIEAHSRSIEFLAHATGGIRVASATAHEVKLWDAFTLELSQTINPGAASGREPAWGDGPTPSVSSEGPRNSPGPTVSAVAVSSYSPLVAFAVHRRRAAVVIWDGSARTTAALIELGGPIVESLAFGAHGSVLAAGLRDGRVLLWDLRREMSGTKPGAPRRMEVPPILDGESEADQRLRILRLNAPVSATLRREIAAHSKPIRALAFTPKAATLITGSADKTAVAWDAATGEKQQTFRGHRGAITSLAIHRKGVRLITGSRDGTARLWEMADGKQVRRYKGHEAAMRSVAVGQSLLTASDDGSARLWRPGTGREERVLRGHISAARLVGLSRDGSRAATRARSGEVALWDTNTGTRAWALPAGSNARGAIALSSNGRLVASEGEADQTTNEAGDAVVRVWDAAAGGDPIGSFPSSLRYRIAMRFVDDDARLLVTPAPYMWPVTREVDDLGEARPVLPTEATNQREHAAYGVQVSGDGRIVFSRAGAEVVVWDAARGNARATWLAPDGATLPMLINHDGSRLLSYATRDRVRLWDAATGELFEELGAATEGATAAAFSHGGEMLVTGSNAQYTLVPGGWTRQRSTGVVKLWSARSGREVRSLPTQDAWVAHVDFSGDDERVVVVAGISVRVYDVGTGNEVASLGPYGSSVASALISHDGDTVVVMTRKGVLDVWRPTPPAIADGDEQTDGAYNAPR